jgi:hypothetical protein
MHKNHVTGQHVWQVLVPERRPLRPSVCCVVRSHRQPSAVPFYVTAALFCSVIYREYCRARLAESNHRGAEDAGWDSTVVYSNGDSDRSCCLGDRRTTKEAFEGGRAVSVYRAAVTPSPGVTAPA